MPEDGQHNGST